MGDLPKAAIIVPCFNEKSRLKTWEFSDFSRKNQDIHFLFVDDGSTDGTGEMLDALCRDHPHRMEWVRLGKNSGKAEAVRAGFLKAFEGDFRDIGYWDADLATPLHVIPRFREFLENPGIRIVMGSRVRLLGRKIQRKAMRHYLGRIFATGASMILGLPVYDTQCGAKLFRNTKELRIVFSRPFRVKWTFDVEILARFQMIERWIGTSPVVEACVEVPLEEWLDIPGSKIRATDFLRGAMDLSRIFVFLRLPGGRKRTESLVRSGDGIR